TEKFSLRPGFRYSIQTKFDNQYSSSISSKFDLGQGFELRNILGSSFRTPNYDELYTSLISSNHIISGNESLIPEKSLSIFIHLNKKSWFEDYSKLISKLKIGYIHVTDRIDLSVISTTPVLTYNYLNLDKHNSLNLSLENTFKYKKLDLKLNATLLGVSETLVNEENYSDEFLYSVQVNSSLSYKIPQMKASILLNYKYNGAQPQFIWQNTDDGEGTYIKGQIDAYNWADISIKKQFLKNFEATFGVRNAFDVTRVDSTLFSGGETHTSGGNRLLIGYGRSYFIKLNYNLNF
ncbi:MAG: TonB-dependent receptor, partial [Bacteroidota bacterium]